MLVQTEDNRNIKSMWNELKLKCESNLELVNQNQFAKRYPVLAEIFIRNASVWCVGILFVVDYWTVLTRHRNKCQHLRFIYFGSF